jgi:hypothetical protein
MQNTNGSDVVAELTSAEARQAFNNWFNSDGKEEFYCLNFTMQNQGSSPGLLRYAMQYSFQHGYKTASEPRTPDFTPGEVYHVANMPLAHCKDCGCVTQHQRLVDHSIQIDGYVCLACDELNVNDYTEFDLVGERV